MNYNEALNFIKQKESLGIKPGLDRIKKTLESLNNPQNSYKIIHVAGTNGKGSVAATIAEALTNSGFKTGLFTSPWVVDYREQIQLDGHFISEQEFTDIIEAVRQYDCSLTEFEYFCVAAYLYFKLQSVDYAVIECGMGGAEDATNVEDKNLSVITSVSLDHTDFLGNSIEEIAEQKAGILRKDCTCVIYNSELWDIFDGKCKRLVVAPEKSNLSLVNTVLKELKVNPASCLKRLPARQELIGGVLLDGGHNVSAAQSLSAVIDDETAVIAMLNDKDVDGYLKLVAPNCKEIIVTEFNHSRAFPAAELYDIAVKYCDNVRIINNPVQAVKENGVTLVCGSFYLAREVRKILLSDI